MTLLIYLTPYLTPLIMGECKINCLLSTDDYSLPCFLNQKMKMVCRDALIG